MNQIAYSAAPPRPTTADRPLHTVEDELVGKTSDLAIVSLVLGLSCGFYVGSLLTITLGHLINWGIIASLLWLAASFIVAVVVGVVVLTSRLRHVTYDAQDPILTTRSNSPRSRSGIAAVTKDVRLSA